MPTPASTLNSSVAVYHSGIELEMAIEHIIVLYDKVRWPLLYIKHILYMHICIHSVYEKEHALNRKVKVDLRSQ